MADKITPTDAELEILHLLWEHGECTVRQINEKLNERREVGYTTTLKIMQIMNEKKLVSRNTNSKIHLYRAILQENQTKGNLLDAFISNAFNGSAQALVMHALGNHNASQSEIDQIKTLISDIENNNKKLI